MTKLFDNQEAAAEIISATIKDVGAKIEKLLDGQQVHYMIVAIPMTPENDAEDYFVVNTFKNAPAPMLNVGLTLIEQAFAAAQERQEPARIMLPGSLN